MPRAGDRWVGGAQPERGLAVWDREGKGPQAGVPMGAAEGAAPILSVESLCFLLCPAATFDATVGCGDPDRFPGALKSLL